MAGRRSGEIGKGKKSRTEVPNTCMLSGAAFYLRPLVAMRFFWGGDDHHILLLAWVPPIRPRELISIFWL